MIFDLKRTSVTNSRYFKGQNTVWRRRKTKKGFVFTTRERVDMSDIMVRKKQKAAEKYSSAKLFISLYRALEHLPDAQNTAWHLLQTVELKLLQKTKDNMQISSTLIAKTCINSLKAFDHTAYIKYASHQPDIVKL